MKAGTCAHWSGPAAMICSAGCWGCATVMSKAALEHSEPMALLVVQLTASVGFLWCIALARSNRGSIRASLWKPGMLGILEPGMAYLFGVFGLERSSASVASLIMGSEPLMVLAVGAGCFHEKLNGATVRAAVVGFLGLAAVVGASDGQVNASLLGPSFVILGTLCAAFYVVLAGRVSSHFDALHLAAVQQTVALMLLLMLASMQASLASCWETMTPNQLLFAAASGVIQYGLSLWAYLVALRRMSFVRAALFLNLIPLFGILCASVFLGEKLLFLQWLGAAIVLMALAKARAA